MELASAPERARDWRARSRDAAGLMETVSLVLRMNNCAVNNCAGNHDLHLFAMRNLRGIGISKLDLEVQRKKYTETAISANFSAKSAPKLR